MIGIKSYEFYSTHTNLEELINMQMKIDFLSNKTRWLADKMECIDAATKKKTFEFALQINIFPTMSMLQYSLLISLDITFPTHADQTAV